MMNSVKEFGQVEINHCLIAVLQISRCFGDGGTSAASGAESVTAGVKGRLEDRLHDLEQRLLNHPINDIWHTPIELHSTLIAFWVSRP